MADEGQPVFVKSSRPRSNLRKRTTELEDDLNTGSTTKIQKRVEENGDEEAGTKHEGLEKLDVFYSTTGEAVPSAMAKEAAVGSAEYDAREEDDRARIEAKLRATNSKKAGVDTEYKGQAGYRSFISLKDTARANATSSKFRVAGPVRASSHIRMTCRFDYAPDLCKDYNETGFCGFGDSCKFVHDRGDYKSGWELEQEWEAAKQREREELEGTTVHVPEVEPLRVEGPGEHCPICDTTFKSPIVVTACEHYFCERCALRHDKDSPKCFTCSTTIDGQFRIYKKKPVV